MAKNPTGLAIDKELKTTDLSPKIILNSFLLTLELHERQPERRAVRSVGATWLLTKSSNFRGEQERVQVVETVKERRKDVSTEEKRTELTGQGHICRVERRETRE